MHYVILKNGTVESFAKASHAQARVTELGDGAVAVGGQQDLKHVDSAVLVTVYNRAASEPESKAKTITKFSDRETAERRVWPVVEYLAKPGTVNEEIVKKAKSTTKTPRKPRAEGSGAAGRPSTFTGKKIFKLVKDNPRRAGTEGFKSFELITSGMLYETYIAAGGRRKDLAWDVDHKFVEVK